MEISILWLLFIMAYLIVIQICFYFIVLKKIGREKRCCEKTVGVVKRMSSIYYGDAHTAVVEYFVNNKKYKVVGPKFLGGTCITVKTPSQDIETAFESNLTSKDNLPLYVHTKIYKNSIACKTCSPILELFPIGSDVDVYYNPNKPKEAYVHRFEGISKIVVGIFVGANMLLLVFAFILFIL
ncbi:DUF3592 domain-containing protein [Tannockella kyphosi]|uniref:DUF3592 domain-containing protein n=1 Tax=Tannockella kyphosi TaxID=2899121 RepID=UPI0020116D65|nr:DUF3592 domain-containing protein [Tannockella kyphosi]